MCVQDAFVPPPDPLQFHVRVVPHDVNPLSDATEPALHTPGVAEHEPLTAQAGLLCVQDAFVPPPDPLQFHVRVVPHDVRPLSDATDPAVHAPGVAEHDPFTAQGGLFDEHDAFVPPPDPLQFHVRVVPHDVRPLSDATDPAVHAPGVAEHDPFTAQGGLFDEHDAFVPPPDPLQFHVRVVPHDVRPLSDATDPAVHAPGVAEHDPFTGLEHEPNAPPEFTAKVV